MKIRQGFVSNSSSSSFVCDVCGNCESGMDASPSDLGMTSCCNGHTFCDCHAEDLPEASSDDIRKNIIEQINKMTWLNADRKNDMIVELSEVDDDDLQEYFDDNYDDDGCAACHCPICSFKAINESDAHKYLLNKYALTDAVILETIKKEFDNYTDFKKSLTPKE